MQDAERKKLRTIFEDLKYTIEAKDNLQEKIQEVTTLVSEHKHTEKLVEAYEQSAQVYQESLQAHKEMIAMDVNVVKTVMDINELSNYIHRTVSWIYQNKKGIPRIQIGEKGTLYFRKNKIDKWLSEYDIPAV